VILGGPPAFTSLEAVGDIGRAVEERIGHARDPVARFAQDREVGSRLFAGEHHSW